GSGRLSSRGDGDRTELWRPRLPLLGTLAGEFPRSQSASALRLAVGTPPRLRMGKVALDPVRLTVDGRLRVDRPPAFRAERRLLEHRTAGDQLCSPLPGLAGRLRIAAGPARLSRMGIPDASHKEQ